MQTIPIFCESFFDSMTSSTRMNFYLEKTLKKIGQVTETENVTGLQIM